MLIGSRNGAPASDAPDRERRGVIEDKFGLTSNVKKVITSMKKRFGGHLFDHHLWFMFQSVLMKDHCWVSYTPYKYPSLQLNLIFELL